ncbi:Trk system potassium uptake protein TrkA [uncultured Gammaproteobacteria bacterium]|nr:Trk system potassium uptake protein TrkA [uncultured Gammaproteobacteria bacterium]
MSKPFVGKLPYPNILEQAEIRTMDMVIAVTKSDEGNMLACQMAHHTLQCGQKNRPYSHR